MLIALLAIGILLSVITYKMNSPIYVTNVTTITIINNTVVNVTSAVNSTQEKKSLTDILGIGNDVGAKVVS